jgi:AhpD family alkylhydroperoxidase
MKIRDKKCVSIALRNFKLIARHILFTRPRNEIEKALKIPVKMGEKVDQFNEYRNKMNDRILSVDNKVVKRIFNVDTNAYTEGALSVKNKELMGLVASLVLRCDDCVKYHLLKCHENNVSEEELFEVMGIATLVGGTIVVPHMRRAVEFWDDMHV